MSEIGGKEYCDRCAELLYDFQLVDDKYGMRVCRDCLIDEAKAERDELRERVRELEDRSLTWNRLCVDLKNQNAKLRAALEAREAVIEHYRDCDACMSGQKCDEGFRLQSGNMARQRRKRS